MQREPAHPRWVEIEVAAQLLAERVGTGRVVVSGNFATPVELLDELVRRAPGIRVFGVNLQSDFATIDDCVIETPFHGAASRSRASAVYVPARLSLVPRLFATTHPPEAVIVQTSPPRDGLVSLGIEVNVLPAAIEAVRRNGGMLVAQVNPQMPFTRGDALVEEQWFDMLVEVDRPLASPVPAVRDEVSDAIASNVAAYVADGDTLQLGIGAIPDAVLSAIGDRRGLGVWSEMLSDGILDLERRGALESDRALTASFLFGSPELYDWVETSGRIVMRRTEIVNDPSHIAANPGMTAINAALQVDLHAQANASYVRGHIYSGFGGQPDFTVGALHSKGGHAIIALRSFHEPTQSSNVLDVLEVPVCTFQHSVIVSEHGSAEIFGCSDAEQATLIVERVADPRARDSLRAASSRLGLA